MTTPTRACSDPRSLALLAALLIPLACAPVARAQVWNEVGDAGDLVSTAQTTTGSGPLTTINGNLSSDTDVDVFCINLSAVPPAGLPIVQLGCAANQGPNVWLFDAAGNGVYTNETCAGGEKAILAPSVSMAPGTYYVAVSYYGLDPQSAGGPIWLSALPGQRSPDGPGSAGALTGWAGTPTAQPINPYTISLAFMNYCDSPTPVSRSAWGALKIRYR